MESPTSVVLLYMILILSTIRSEESLILYLKKYVLSWLYIVEFDSSTILLSISIFLSVSNLFCRICPHQADLSSLLLMYVTKRNIQSIPFIPYKYYPILIHRVVAFHAFLFMFCLPVCILITYIYGFFGCYLPLYPRLGSLFHLYGF